MFLAAMPIALPYHICRLGEPCDKPCRFAAMYNNASFRVCRHARFCRPSDIREPRSRLPLGSSPSPSTPQKSSRHAAGLLNGTGMEGFGRSGHSPLGGEWLKLVDNCPAIGLSPAQLLSGQNLLPSPRHLFATAFANARDPVAYGHLGQCPVVAPLRPSFLDCEDPLPGFDRRS